MADEAIILFTQLADDGTYVRGKPSIALFGRAMPYQGLELEGSMRMETTWYPGNAVATVQMLGAQEKPTTFKGMWKDKFLASVTDEGTQVEPTAIVRVNGSPVASVMDLVNAFELMRLAGKLIRFQWGDIIRVGVLARFKQNWIRFEDCEWELEFQWTSRGEVQSPVTLPVAPDSSSFASDMAKLVTSLQDAIDTASQPFQVVEKFSSQVDSAFNVIDDASLEMANSVSNTTQLISTPADSAARGLAAAESIKDSAGSIVTAVEQFPPLELIKTTSPESLDLADALLADTYGRRVKAAARALQAFAAQQGDTLRAALDQDTLLAAFVARAPMDLRDVSQRYYNTPDEWRTLLAYNEMDSSELGVGDLVLVPKIGAADGRV